MANTPKLMAVQGAAVFFAVGFLIVGVMGFIPGVTTHYDLLQWAGHHSGAELFGVFAVSVLHNAIHIVFGLAGLAMARSYALARAWFLLGGVAFLGLWAYGLLIDHDSAANIVPVNSADNWLHMTLGAVMLLLAVTLAGQHDPTKGRAQVPT